MNLFKDRYFYVLALPITFFTSYGIICSMGYLKNLKFSSFKNKKK